MARPNKNNLSYFSHDIDLRNDLKVKAVRIKYQHQGYAIYIMLLEHLSDCDYLQYEWNDLNIELLTADFGIDRTNLIEIVDYCVKLNLLQIEEGVLFCEKLLVRNEQVLNKRAVFDMNMSPIAIKKKNKLSTPIVSGEFPQQKPDGNRQSKVKNSKVEESKVEESKVEERIQEETIEQNKPADATVEDRFNRKAKLAEIIKQGFAGVVPDIIKRIDINDVERVYSNYRDLWNKYQPEIMEYQSIRLI